MDVQPEPSADLWSDWLLHIRHADDADYQSVVRAEITKYADRVIDAAQLAPGMRVIDVGTGDGLVGLRAIERMGASLQVIFTDISPTLLRAAEDEARRMGVESQCTFLQCSAEHLVDVPSSTVDAVLTRASVAYVADKRAVFREFHRILKPEGCISLAEPVLQEEAFWARVLKQRVQASHGQPQDRFLVLVHRWKSAQFPDSEEVYARTPHVNYSERDLLHWVRGAGFVDIHLQLHIDIVPSDIRSWSLFLGVSPHPLAPTLGRIMAESFSKEERDLFERMMRPKVERGENETINRVAFLIAKRGSPPAAGTLLGP